MMHGPVNIKLHFVSLIQHSCVLDCITRGLIIDKHNGMAAIKSAVTTQYYSINRYTNLDRNILKWHSSIYFTNRVLTEDLCCVRLNKRRLSALIFRSHYAIHTNSPTQTLESHFMRRNMLRPLYVCCRRRNKCVFIIFEFHLVYLV